MPFKIDPVEGLAYKPIGHEPQQHHAKEDHYKKDIKQHEPGHYKGKKSPHRLPEKRKRNQKFVEKYTARTNARRGREERKGWHSSDVDIEKMRDNGDKISYHLWKVHQRKANRKEAYGKRGDKIQEQNSISTKDTRKESAPNSDIPFNAEVNGWNQDSEIDFWSTIEIKNIYQSTNKEWHPKSNNGDKLHPEDEILNDRMQDLKLCQTKNDSSKTEYSMVAEDTSHYHRQIQQSQDVLQELRKSIRGNNFNHFKDSEHSSRLKSQPSAWLIPDKQYISENTGTNRFLSIHPHPIHHDSNESVLSDMSSKWSDASYSMLNADESLTDLTDTTGTSIRNTNQKNGTGKKTNGRLGVPSPLAYDKNDIPSESSQDELSVHDNNSLAIFPLMCTDSEEFKRMVELTKLNNDDRKITDKKKTKTNKRKKPREIFQIDLDEPYNRNEASSSATEEMVLYREHGIYIPISSRIPIRERSIKSNGINKWIQTDGPPIRSRKSRSITTQTGVNICLYASKKLQMHPWNLVDYLMSRTTQTLIKQCGTSATQTTTKQMKTQGTQTNNKKYTSCTCQTETRTDEIGIQAVATTNTLETQTTEENEDKKSVSLDQLIRSRAIKRSQSIGQRATTYNNGLIERYRSSSADALNGASDIVPDVQTSAESQDTSTPGKISSYSWSESIKFVKVFVSFSRVHLLPTKNIKITTDGFNVNLRISSKEVSKRNAVTNTNDSDESQQKEENQKEVISYLTLSRLRRPVTTLSYSVQRDMITINLRKQKPVKWNMLLYR